MPYKKIIAHLHQKAYQRGINYSLDNLLGFLKELGNPQQKLKNIIHIAGTNGKGSTLTFIASALQENGYQVGTFTSPHLFDYTERICVNFKPIGRGIFSRIFTEIASKPGFAKLTEFEILTVLSILYFAEKKPDFIIYETGLGGRLDATNIFMPIITIITKIDLEHQAILGKTLRKIASEKAGIIKPKVPIITIKQSKNVLEVIAQTARNVKAPLYIEKPVKKIPVNFTLNASYQKMNLALAQKCLALLSGMGFILEQAISQRGLQKAKILGRYQEIRNKKIKVIIDAAHNPAGVRALLKSLKKDGISKPSFVIGILKTKDARRMIEEISAFAKEIYYCDFEPGASFSFEEICRLLPDFKFRKFKFGQSLAGLNEPVFVLTGSIYFLGRFQEIL